MKRSRAGGEKRICFLFSFAGMKRWAPQGVSAAPGLAAPPTWPTGDVGMGPVQRNKTSPLSFGLSWKPGWVCSACTKYVFSWALQSASHRNGEAAFSLLLSLLNPWQGEVSWIWGDLEKVTPMLAWLIANTAIVLARDPSGSVDLFSPGRGSSQAHRQHPSWLSQEKKHEYLNRACTSSTQNSFRHSIDIY